MDNLHITGALRVTKTDINGNTTVNKYTNNIMVNGKVLVAKFLSNQKPLAPTRMAVGTGTTAVDPSQLDLTSEIYSKDINSSLNEANVAVIDCVFGQGEAVGSLREAGLFTPGGLMVARALINEDKGIYQELTISWEITVN
jgi:hypothetical protein